MKNMKKLLALLLALAMCLAMTACGSEPKGSVSSGNSGAPAPEATPEPTPTPEPEDELELGSMVGGTYENSFAGIGCKLDDSWVYLSDEEIRVQNEITIDAIDDEELAELLSDKGTFFDMMAMSEEGLATVNVVVENLGLLYGTVLDTSGYVDISLKNLESQLGSMGLNVSTCEKDSFDFCGKSTDGIYVSGTMNAEGMEIEMFERMACVKAGTYMFIVTVCTYVEDGTAELLDLFYAV